MKKNITALLQKGNLTPSERYLLLIENDFIKLTTGTEPLTEADKNALTNWQAKTSWEAKEWNKFNDSYNAFMRAGMEAEFIYAETKAEHFRNNIITTELSIYPFYREHFNAVKALKKIKIVDIKEAIKITNRQREEQLKGGLDFDYAVYLFTFESLSDEIRKDILILDTEAEYEPSYLNDEETIADLLNGKDELDKEAKEKYAELVADRSYNKFAKEYQLHLSFASLPIMDIAKKWAKDKGIKPRQKDYEWLEKTDRRLFKKAGINTDENTKDEFYKKIKEEKGGDKDEWLLEENLKEILEDYARDNKTTIKQIIKETLLKWLEQGLPYPPLVISKDKKTYGEDTKLPHNELFKEWLKAKDKARETLKTLADKGDLKLTTDETGQDKTITGESLYNFKGDFKFVKDFKERVNNYTAGLGIVYADDDPEHKGENIDRELLIATKNNKGELNALSLFGMATEAVERIAKFRYFKETEKDGETYLEFKGDYIEKAFKETRQSLIDGYAKLLAFAEVFKRLSKTYNGINVNYLANKKIEQVSEFIEQLNNALSNALDDLYGFGIGFGLYKKPLKTRENLFIEKDKILPDTETLEEWNKKFMIILGNDF